MKESEFISRVNKFKMLMESAHDRPPRVFEWRPLVVKPHPREREMRAYASLPSAYR